jgi:hypothetical protein
MAIAAAGQGEMPPFTQNSLLETLHLDGEEPDGRTLIDRLTNDEINSTTLRTITPLSDAADELLDLANKHETNGAQEVVAKALGGVITKQLTREGDICPDAKYMARTCTRDDIVPPEVRASLERNFRNPLDGLTDDEIIAAVGALLRMHGDPATMPREVYILLPFDDDGEV